MCSYLSLSYIQLDCFYLCLAWNHLLYHYSLVQVLILRKPHLCHRAHSRRYMTQIYNVLRCHLYKIYKLHKQGKKNVCNHFRSLCIHSLNHRGIWWQCFHIFQFCIKQFLGWSIHRIQHIQGKKLKDNQHQSILHYKPQHNGRRLDLKSIRPNIHLFCNDDGHYLRCNK